MHRYRIVFLLAAALLFPAAASRAALQVTVGESSVTARGATPSGRVVLFDVRAGTRHSMTFFRSRAVQLIDTDGDGAVTFTPADGVLDRSVWVAVDVESGDFAISGKREHAFARPDPGMRALARNGAGEIRSFVVQADNLHVLVVRPKTGAWTLIARDGGFGDADRAGNGSLSVDWSVARPVEDAGSPPAVLRGGDLIFVVDPMHMDVYAQRVPGSVGGER